jgi:hypothetical protein
MHSLYGPLCTPAHENHTNSTFQPTLQNLRTGTEIKIITPQVTIRDGSSFLIVNDYER